MKKTARRMYEESRRNTLFRNELVESGEDDSPKELNYDTNMRILFASIYMGWLLGRGEYKASNYNY